MRKLTLSLAVMAALMPARGYPLGLGEIELNSALNQELNAEIEVLSATPEDADQLIVKLADRDAFSRAGIDRPFLLQQLKFKISEKNGKPVVKVYTRTPIREPYLNFLLEIDWPKGHLLREYTLLLDPPIYNTGVTSTAVQTGEDHPFIEPTDATAQPQSAYQQQQAQPAQGSYGTVAGTSQTGVISSDSGRSMSYQYQAMPQATSTPDQYRVQQNDTLWSIANRMRPDSSVSVEQMMLALVRKNPEAFIQENINGVKRGYILRVPTRDEATQLDRQQAVAQAREHASLWREYSQASTAAAPASSMEVDQEASMPGDQPVRDSEGQLSILGASDTEGSEFAGSNQDPNAELSRLKQELAMAREQLESEKMEKEDLRSRLADLEQRVQRVIEMDDGELAKLQQDLQQPSVVEESIPEMPMEDAPVMDEAPAELIEEEAPVEEGMPVDELAPQELMPEEMPAEEAPVDEALETMPTDEEGAVFVDETVPADVIEGEEPVDMQAPAIQPVQTIEPPAFAQKQPKGFLDSLMNDPKLLGIIGGGLAFVMLLLALLLKRIRGGKSDEEAWDAALENDDLDLDVDDTTQVKHDESLDETTEMMVEPATSESTDSMAGAEAEEESLEDTVFSLDDNKPEVPADDAEKDDVLAEADVYLAYGIYQQAEDLLNNAIDQNPERDDYRMKLMEVHYAAKNATAFEQLAKDVQARKGNDKSYWGRVAAMGMELCPGSSVFAGAGDMLSNLDPEALLPDRPQKADLELDADTSAASDMASELGDDLDLGAELDELSLDTHTDIAADELDLGTAGDELDLGTDTDTAGDELSLDGGLDDLGGDFDLDAELDLGETTETEAMPEMDLSSDLAGDLENLTTEFEAPAAEAEMDLDGGLDADTDLDMDDDFSLDFEASDLGFEESDDELTATGDESASVELDADLDLGVDLEEPEAVDDVMEMDLGDDLGGDDTEIDLGDDIELDLDSDTEVADDLDLGDTELDLGDDIDLDAGMSLDDAEAMDVSTDLDDSDFDISELSEDIDEVSTKLDLARAYIDMGDNEGARSILEEVKAEGNDEQQQQANELLQQAS